MKNNQDKLSIDIIEEERINRFLRGEMSSEEETTFMDELKSNDVLRNKAVVAARMAKAMKTVGEEEDSLVKEALLTSDDHDIEMIVKNVTRKRSKLLTLRIISVAASILILVISGWHYYDYRVTTGLGNEYEMEIESSSFVRGAGTGSVNKELNSLFTKVKSGDESDNTIKRLSLLWELSTMDTYNDYSDYAPQIGWNLAIAYLKDNDKDNAMAVLTKLEGIAEDGTAIKNKCIELINKLKYQIFADDVIYELFL